MRDASSVFDDQSGGPMSEGSSDLKVQFLAQDEQTGTDVAMMLADFISGAQQSLDIAIYDFRLSDPLRAIVAAALHERAEAGVTIRIVYDSDKPEQPDLTRGMDPAPSGTGAFVQALGYPYRRIGGMKLMHQKYIARDVRLPGARIWTGSANFTDDSWHLCDNNVLQIASPALAPYYERDFEGLWQTETMENTGAFDTQPAHLAYEGTHAIVHVFFSPGKGEIIDRLVAQRVRAAQRSVRICSMLMTSGALINALDQVLAAGEVALDGVYDGTQMEQVFQQWQEVPQNHWKIPTLQRVIEGAHLIGKESTPYKPGGRHDFMHNKVLLIDDTVITGSYNFSHSAEQNAENVLFIESAALVDTYSQYIDHLKRKYGSEQR